MKRIGWVALTCALAVGCGTPAERVAQRRSGITDGVDHTGHPAVGMVLGYTSVSKKTKTVTALCTGTLVGAKTVLTAAHCLQDPALEYRFYINGTLLPLLNVPYGGTEHLLASSTVHPAYDATTQENDIAVLRLQDAPAAAPIPIWPEAVWIGLKIQLIGYGRTSATTDDSGKKRSAYNFVAKLLSKTLSYSGTGNGVGNTCKGDSGGPVLATIDGKDLLAGVHYASTCGTVGYASRLDVHASWVTTASQGDLAPPPPLSDTAAPAVAITAPLSGATVGSDVTVLATATDPGSGLQSINLSVDGQHRATAYASPATFPLVGLTPGAHALSATAHDNAGNSASDSVSVTVGADLPDGGVAGDVGALPDVAATDGAAMDGAADGGTADRDADAEVADDVPPTVAITAPRAGATVGSDLTVEVSADDVGSGLHSVMLEVDGTLWDMHSSSPAAFEVHGLAAGEHELRASAEDNAGNTRSVTIRVTVSVASRSGGCGYGGRRASDGWLPGLLLALVLAGLRRRYDASAQR